MKILRKNINWNDVFSLIITILGPPLILLAIVLISSAGYLFFSFVLPWYQLKWYLEIIWKLFAVFFLYCTAFHYGMCIFLDPGTPALATETLFENNNDTIIELTTENQIPSCQKCDRLRYPRVHHCSVCKSCRFKFDQ